MATFSDGTSRNVTTEATWQTANATVAVVSPVGLVVTQSAGSVEIKATFQSRTGGLNLSVVGDEPPSGAPVALACGVERWPVKTLSDSDAGRVDLARVRQTTIKELNERPTHCSGLPSARTYQEEFEVYEVVGRVTFVRLEDDRDYHIAVADPTDSTYTMVTEVADIACQGAVSSPHRDAISAARNSFVVMLGGRPPSSLVGATVRLRGVGFFDFNHGQNGRARNCMELHPVVAIERH